MENIISDRMIIFIWLAQNYCKLITFKKFWTILNKNGNHWIFIKFLFIWYKNDQNWFNSLKVVKNWKYGWIKYSIKKFQNFSVSRFCTNSASGSFLNSQFLQSQSGVGLETTKSYQRWKDWPLFGNMERGISQIDRRQKITNIH